MLPLPGRLPRAPLARPHRRLRGPALPGARGGARNAPDRRAQPHEVPETGCGNRAVQYHQVLHRGMPRGHHDHRQRDHSAQGACGRRSLRSCSNARPPRNGKKEGRIVTAPRVAQRRVARPHRVLPLSLIVLVASCGGKRQTSVPGPPANGGAPIQALLVVAGFSGPLGLETAPGDSTRLFIVEKPGTIQILRNGALDPRPFLDISSRVSNGSEQGLLGLAVHPQYAANGKFYVDYTDRAGDTHVVEFLVSANPDSASATEREILFVDQPASNHNGGQLTFGPDGFLYVALGDGGGAGDTYQNGQNLGSLVAKILRLDVDSGSPYSIPADNPFVGRTGARGETWDYGLRNPWRFSFDRHTGDLYIADVGQNLWEEVDYEPHRAGGKNYGWSIMEGLHCFASPNCNPT